MRDYIRYVVFLLLLTTAGCIKKEAIEATPPDSTAANLRSLLTNNFSFSMFYEALKKTGADTLLDNETGGYTLLAPDNAAFGRSGITADSLRKMSTDDLRKLILYHVVPGKIGSAGIPQAYNFPYPTLALDSLYTSTTSLDTNLYVNGVTVVKKNIYARNGVIHALEKALTVPARSVQDILALNPDYSCLVAGLKKFGQWDALDTRKPCVILAPTNEAFASYNWDVDGINNMQVADYKKLVFDSYVLSPAFFFLTDMKVAAPSGPFLKDDVLLSIVRTNNGNGIRIKVFPLNYRDPEYNLRTIFYGDWVDLLYSKPGKLAVNGIVHQLDQLPVIPDSARIR
ncbi:fasciclin domain-containing protein [Chitinophaga sp. RAB17]|uniref:fasciclin domain-containing protein n=1 Tax=Chitinophaga sp. RAB17 TaxID=3233049 RepID=UPI003F92DB8B